MNIIKTPIEGLLVIEPQVFKDARGYFVETYNEQRYRDAGIDAAFVQDNQSCSSYGVVRGLHFQRPPYTQAKLVTCTIGKVLDVAVDLRKGSPTFGQWFSVELSEENKRQFFIPRGFAHGFLVLSEQAEFCYKCDDFYHPNDESGLAWNDPKIGIEWPEVTGTYSGTASAEGYHLSDGAPLVLSEKDQKWLGIRDTFRF